MAKIIIGITGLLSSGKGTAAEYIVEKYNGKSFRFSTMLRDVLQRLYLEQSRDNLSHISTVLRQQFGQDLLAKVLAADAAQALDPIIVVEGIRRQEDIVHLQSLPGFTLIAIEADESVRFERLKQRGENSDDGSKTWEQFKRDHELETEVTIPGVMAQADVKINNNGNVDDLHRQIDTIINQLQHGS